MKELLITSSVLILVLLALRWAFRSRITRRAQYALWALVLVRLLVPFSLPGADFSVLTAAQPVEAASAWDASCFAAFTAWVASCLAALTAASRLFVSVSSPCLRVVRPLSTLALSRLKSSRRIRSSASH